MLPLERPDRIQIAFDDQGLCKPRNWCRSSSRECLALLKYRSIVVRFLNRSFHR